MKERGHVQPVCNIRVHILYLIYKKNQTHDHERSTLKVKRALGPEGAYHLEDIMIK